MAAGLGIAERLKAAASAIGLFGDSTIGEQAGVMLHSIGQAGEPPSREIANFAEAYSKSPWLRAVTSKVAVAVARQPWRLYQGTERGRKRVGLIRSIKYTDNRKSRAAMIKSAVRRGELREIDSHELLSLFDQPNAYFSGVVTRRLQQVYYEVNGEAYYLIDRAHPGGPPIGLWPVPPAWILRTPTIENRTFKVNFRGWHSDIPESEILWHVDPNPVNPYGRGSGTAMALADELDTDEYAAKFVKSRFYNRALPDVIVWPKGTDAANAAALKQVKQKWMSEHGGVGRAFRAFFSSREIDVKVLSQTMQELQVTNLREFERDTCIQTFGMSPEMLGVLSNSNRATIDAADYHFSRWCVDPRLEVWRAFYQHRLVPMFDPSLVLDYDSPIAEDKAFQLDAMKARPEAYSVDEWRAVGGADELPDGAGVGRFVPIGVQYVRDLDDIAVEPEPVGGDPLAGQSGGDPHALDPHADDGEDPAEDDTEDPAEDPAEGKSLSPARAVPRYRRAKGSRSSTAATTSAIIIATRLEGKARREFLRALAKLATRANEGALGTALEAGDIEAVIAAFSWASLDTDLGPALAVVLAAYQAAGAAEARVISTQLAIDLSFDTANAAAVAYARELPMILSTYLSDTAKRALREAVARTLGGDLTRGELVSFIKAIVGLTGPQTRSVWKFRANLVEQGVDEASIAARTAKYAAALLRKRAELIARDQINESANKGQRQLWDQAMKSGMLDASKTERQWIVTHDDRLDAKICEPMDGQTIPYGDVFVDGEGNPVDDPPAHIGCRCSQRLKFTK